MPIEDKLREGRLSWFGHVKRRNTETPVRQVEHIRLEDRKKRRGRPKLIWRRVVQHDLEVLHIPEDFTKMLRVKRRKRIYIADPKFLG